MATRGTKTPARRELKSDRAGGRRASLVREEIGGHPYVFYPLGEHIVSAPRVCGGRPTFKYTRIDVRHVLRALAAGDSSEHIVADFEGRVSRAAVEEAARLERDMGAQFFERVEAWPSSGSQEFEPSPPRSVRTV